MIFVNLLMATYYLMLLLFTYETPVFGRRMKLPILREDYLVDCIERGKKLPFDLYKIEAIGGERHSLVTVKVKGSSAVHESSGLQDSGHILEDGKSIYNTTLSMSDLSTGVNR